MLSIGLQREWVWWDLCQDRLLWHKTQKGWICAVRRHAHHFFAEKPVVFPPFSFVRIPIFTMLPTIVHPMTHFTWLSRRRLLVYLLFISLISLFPLFPQFAIVPVGIVGPRKVHLPIQMSRIALCFAFEILIYTWHIHFGSQTERFFKVALAEI